MRMCGLANDVLNEVHDLNLIKVDYCVLSLAMSEVKCVALVYFGVAHGVTDVDLWRLLSFCPIISREQSRKIKHARRVHYRPHKIRLHKSFQDLKEYYNFVIS